MNVHYERTKQWRQEWPFDFVPEGRLIHAKPRRRDMVPEAFDLCNTSGPVALRALLEAIA